MIRVKTTNEEMLFDDKEEVVKYFNESLDQEPKDRFFDNGGYWLEIEGERIMDWSDWEDWKEFFSQTVHDALEGLNDLVGVEFTLLEMDNEIQDLLYETDKDNQNSIFDGDTEEFMARGEYSYTIWANEEKEDTVDINVHFEIHDEDLADDIKDYTAIITEIEEL